MEENPSLSAFGASDFVDLALEQIPTYIGRLKLLADLRDERTGCYTDPLAVLLYGKRLEAILEQRHRELFFAWLRLDLATQTTQVAHYLGANDHGQNTWIEQWIQKRLYERLIPPAAREVERKLFVSDMMTILLLLQGKPHSPGESHR